jgi:hypothetical protein
MTPKRAFIIQGPNRNISRSISHKHIEEGWPLSSANLISLWLGLVQIDEGCLETLVAKLSKLVVVKC